MITGDSVSLNGWPPRVSSAAVEHLRWWGRAGREAYSTSDFADKAKFHVAFQTCILRICACLQYRVAARL